jgi:hypothetical protein
MDVIFKIISNDPEFFLWAFGVINVFWGIFLYFNKKRHQRELINLKQSLDLDLERRKKVFEMKTAQYEDYFKNMDAMHNRHQNDYQEVVLPIINEFNDAYQRACVRNDSLAATEATIIFQEKIGKLTYDGFEEVQIIRSQTNTLRLTASDQVALYLDELQVLYDQLFQTSTKMVSDLVKVTIHGDHALAEENQNKLNELGEITKDISLKLREQMRCDLKAI